MAGQYLVSRAIKLDANGQAIDHTGGGVFVFDTSGASVSIDLTWLDDRGNEAGTVKGVLLGRLLRAGAQFSGYRITGGVANDTLQILIGPDDAYARESAQQINIGHVIVDNEVEVKNDAGNPLAVASDEPARPRGVTLADDTSAGLVAVNDVGVALVAADATRKSVRFRNTGANSVALIAAAANSFDNAAVVLQPGDIWNEIEAPGAAWFGKCGAGLASTLAVQTVKP